jgi:putative FmdB family regulatory protein
VPTYQYTCTECGHGFEQFQSFSDDALTECPTCGGRVRKVFNSVGIVFKGSGFYRNDSRETTKGKGGASKDKESVGSGSKDSTSDKGADKSSPAKTPDKSTGSDTKSSSSSSDKGSSPASKSGPSSTAGSAA